MRGRDALPDALSRIRRSQPFRRVVRRKGAVGQELDLRAFDELRFVHAAGYCYERRPAGSRLQSECDAHNSNALSARARIEHQLRTSALRLPGKRCRNHAATDRPAPEIERLGIRVGVDGDFRGPTASRGLEGMRKKRPADAQVHESRQDPEMVELPRTTQRRKRGETGDFDSDHCDKGRPRADALWRYGQLGTPAFQNFGRITPVRLGSHGQPRKELSLSLNGWPNVRRLLQGEGTAESLGHDAAVFFVSH